MSTLRNKKQLSKLMALCGAVAATAFLSGCGQSGAPAESFERSDYYTRGIGSYPGDPKEDFSPDLKPDQTYRNLALLRSAYHSSSYDYNLTAQLITDGVVSEQQPQYLDLTTQDGEVARREREWMIDRGPYSRNAVVGADAYYQFALKNGWKEKADEVKFRGSVAFDQNKVKGGYAIICEGSNDGSTWVELGSLKGNGMPGKESRYKAHSDPNKNSWDPGELPTRSLNESIPLHNNEAYANYRMRFQMEGAVYWSFYEIDFYEQGQAEPIDLLPSKFFNSAWMSATAGEEWVYVDLGSQSDFDKVKLSWINKAVKGKIQSSVDAKQWNDLAELPGGDALVDEISVKGKGRYVRVLMSESANKDRYILSEFG